MRRSGSRRLSRRALTLLSTALLALLTVSSALAQQPTRITQEADKMHDLYLFVTFLGLVVFVLVTGALLYAIVRFRKKDDTLPRQTHGSTLLEMLWVSIPVLLVLVMFAYSVVVVVDVEDSAEPEDLTVHVTGFQFQWQFTYNLDDLGTRSVPGSDETIQILGTGTDEPRLVIPVGEPVEFRLASNDVIHSFYIPSFLYKLDVIPGRDNAFKVTANKTGVYQGQCAELCGVDHALMRFSIEVMSRDDFDAWVTEQSGAKLTAKQP